MAARYGVAPEYVERLIEDAIAPAPAPRGLQVRGNRIALAVVFAWLGWFLSGSLLVLLPVGVLTYVALTMAAGRRH